MAQKRFRSRLTGAGVRLKRSFGAGASAGQNITIPGIKLGDDISSAFVIEGTASTAVDVILDDVTDEISIVAANTVKLSTTNTAARQLDVHFWSKRG